ncbi:Yap5p NDAI_0H01490 [Naumovozyma dairenensis CBS 421]|uniref:BZIP domain-containing protein n=1 Tax=Naumovozyma dairenensis (strain ATCC 10597 / BCRC 20456 / CBS 421 / NBRC 0211 / NRRL Y-12639) TaxID=1071378 RepID=G0WEW2_NAUDC|nr:hypothetical protein NDAI_0H01490 [Naumovozyma dairenensis CBS 421]CCD26323.1 hypothetical protein NDAI_0H01490 [Naumovozyma dairenensis CBS 421]
MDENSAVEMKYANLKPKSSPDNNNAISKIRVSKNWKLPPRLNTVKRSSSAGKCPISTANSPNNSNNIDISAEDENEDEMKKKIQNRDAQRAYRERKANRMKNLEDTVDSLQILVKTWQQKYKNIEKRLIISEKKFEDSTKENQILKESLLQMKNGLMCNICLKPISEPQQKLLPMSEQQQSAVQPVRYEMDRDANIQVDRQASPSSFPIIEQETPPKVSLTRGKDLQKMIEDFRPMKAAVLKNMRISKPKKSSTKMDNSKQISSKLQLNLSQKSRDNSSMKSSEVFTVTTANKIVDAEKKEGAMTDEHKSHHPLHSASKCGFCNEGTSCVCNELEATENATPLDRISSFSPLVNGDDLSNDRRNNDSNNTGKLIFDSHCSATPESCTKCANIDETCLKPITNNNNNSNKINNLDVDFNMNEVSINSNAFSRIRKQMQKNDSMKK